MNRRAALALIAAAVIAALAWFRWPEGEARAIRRRLDALAQEINTTGEGVAMVTRAARLRHFFTHDVVVDLGRGAAPISGRETLVGMTARFRPATTSLVVGVKDVAVARRKGTGIADVALTVTLSGRDSRTGDATMDAREFSLEMRKEGGEWQISRGTAVEPLR